MASKKPDRALASHKHFVDLTATRCWLAFITLQVRRSNKIKSDSEALKIIREKFPCPGANRNIKGFSQKEKNILNINYWNRITAMEMTVGDEDLITRVEKQREFSGSKYWLKHPFWELMKNPLMSDLQLNQVWRKLDQRLNQKAYTRINSKRAKHRRLYSKANNFILYDSLDMLTLQLILLRKNKLGTLTLDWPVHQLTATLLLLRLACLNPLFSAVENVVRIFYIYLLCLDNLKPNKTKTEEILHRQDINDVFSHLFITSDKSIKTFPRVTRNLEKYLKANWKIMRDVRKNLETAGYHVGNFPREALFWADVHYEKWFENKPSKQAYHQKLDRPCTSFVFYSRNRMPKRIW